MEPLGCCARINGPSLPLRGLEELFSLAQDSEPSTPNLAYRSHFKQNLQGQTRQYQPNHNPHLRARNLAWYSQTKLHFSVTWEVLKIWCPGPAQTEEIYFFGSGVFQAKLKCRLLRNLAHSTWTTYLSERTFPCLWLVLLMSSTCFFKMSTLFL